LQSEKTMTIFTPTYNRAYILQRVYNSLCIQSDLDFEWLIIDDGSEDDRHARIDLYGPPCVVG